MFDFLVRNEACAKCGTVQQLDNYLRTKQASDDRNLKFYQLQCINEQLANDVLLVSKTLFDNEEAWWTI